MREKGFAALTFLLLLGVLVVFYFGYTVTTNKSSFNNQFVDIITPSGTSDSDSANENYEENISHRVDVTANQEIPSNWKTFTYPGGEITLRYPPHWIYRDDSESKLYPNEAFGFYNSNDTPKGSFADYRGNEYLTIFKPEESYYTPNQDEISDKGYAVFRLINDFTYIYGSRSVTIRAWESDNPDVMLVLSTVRFHSNSNE